MKEYTLWQQPTTENGSEPQKKEEPSPPPEEKTAVTKHKVVLGGKTISYTATCGTLHLKDEAEDKVKGAIFFTAYTKDRTKASARPITFAFNGGPGSSSVWLHLGFLGPKRVQFSKEGFALKPPATLTDNAESLLDVTDLVFVDPIATGFSRAHPYKDDRKFFGVREDIEANAEFIRLYLSRFKRWNSPKFLAGESYGTMRSCGLAHDLQERLGISLNGLLLISSALDYQAFSFDRSTNVVPYGAFLPSFTAAAHFHKKLEKRLQKDFGATLKEVEAFTLDTYLPALLKGNRLSSKERKTLAEKLASYTGLEKAYIEKCNLKVSASRFFKELLRQERLTLGRFDCRYTGRDRDAAGEHIEYDPSYTNVLSPFTTCWNQYMREDLGFDSDAPYDILSFKVIPNWRWADGEAKNQYVSMVDRLRDVMHKNAHLNVFIASGYYDLATPYFGADYLTAHLGDECDTEKRLTTRYYEAGHMMFIHDKSRRELSQHTKTFVKKHS